MAKNASKPAKTPAKTPTHAAKAAKSKAFAAAAAKSTGTSRHPVLPQVLLGSPLSFSPSLPSVFLC
jgi:hypothetical protein